MTGFGNNYLDGYLNVTDLSIALVLIYGNRVAKAFRARAAFDTSLLSNRFQFPGEVTPISPDEIVSKVYVNF